jgi:hypothetical protein
MLGIVMDCTAKELSLIPGRDRRFLASPKHPDGMPTHPTIQWVPKHISLRVNRPDRKLITKPHRVPRSRMAGAPPPHLHMRSGCARDIFTSASLLLYHKYGAHLAFIS